MSAAKYHWQASDSVKDFPAQGTVLHDAGIAHCCHQQ